MIWVEEVWKGFECLGPNDFKINYFGLPLRLQIIKELIGEMAEWSNALVC